MSKEEGLATEFRTVYRGELVHVYCTKEEFETLQEAKLCVKGLPLNGRPGGCFPADILSVEPIQSHITQVAMVTFHDDEAGSESLPLEDCSETLHCEAVHPLVEQELIFSIRTQLRLSQSPVHYCYVAIYDSRTRVCVHSFVFKHWRQSREPRRCPPTNA